MSDPYGRSAETPLQSLVRLLANGQPIPDPYETHAPTVAADWRERWATNHAGYERLALPL